MEKVYPPLYLANHPPSTDSSYLARGSSSIVFSKSSSIQQIQATVSEHCLQGLLVQVQDHQQGFILHHIQQEVHPPSNRFRLANHPPSNRFRQQNQNIASKDYYSVQYIWVQDHQQGFIFHCVQQIINRLKQKVHPPSTDWQQLQPPSINWIISRGLLSSIFSPGSSFMNRLFSSIFSPGSSFNRLVAGVQSSILFSRLSSFHQLIGSLAGFILLHQQIGSWRQSQPPSINWITQPWLILHQHIVCRGSSQIGSRRQSQPHSPSQDHPPSTDWQH